MLNQNQLNAPLFEQSDFQKNLIEKLWQQLNGTVSYLRVSQVVAEVTAKFQDATVTNYLPIFIQRYAWEKLAEELKSQDSR